jgi:hypothetical protein
MISYNLEYLSDGTHWNTISEVLSQKGASQNGILEPFLPGIGAANTTPLQPNFGSLLVFKKNSAGYS